MDELNFIETYYNGTKAYTLFLLKIMNNLDDVQDYILEPKYQCAAKVGFISNVLLNIKEDIVENVGNLNYESKLYEETLEQSVEILAQKTENGYIIDNHLFKNPSSLIATLRNKIAHGDYTIDFNKNQLILNIEQKKVSIDINKLTLFIIYSFRNTLQNIKTKEYKRNITVFEKQQVGRTTPIKEDKEIISIIKDCKNIEFVLTRENNEEIEQHMIIIFNDFLKQFKNRDCDFDFIQKAKKNFKEKGYKITATYSKITKQRQIEELLPLIKNSIIAQEKNTYEAQLKSMLNEIQRKINSMYDTFNPLGSNINNLILLSKVEEKQTTNPIILAEELKNQYDAELYLNYDNIATSIISIFNSLYSVPYDKNYKQKEEEKGLDFSKLDLSKVKVIVNNTEEELFLPTKQHLEGLTKTLQKIEEKQKETNENLNKVLENNNINAIKILKNSIQDLENKKQKTTEEINNLIKKLEEMNNYYENNELYSKNKSIIEGIRNSIAHGNYEVKQGQTIPETKLIFNNPYKQELVFKAEITIDDFMELLAHNAEVIQDYFNETERKTISK